MKILKNIMAGLAFSIGIGIAQAQIPTVSVSTADGAASEPYEAVAANGTTYTYIDNGSFIVTRTGNNNQPLMVSYEFLSGPQYATAACGVQPPGNNYPCGWGDFTLDGGSCGSVVIPGGSSSALIEVRPSGDYSVEENELITLKLKVASGYTIGSGPATIILYERPLQPYAVRTIKGGATENQTPADPLIFQIYRPQGIAEPPPPSYIRPGTYSPGNVGWYLFRRGADNNYTVYRSGLAPVNGASSYDVYINPGADDDTQDEQVKFALVSDLDWACSTALGTINDYNIPPTVSVSVVDSGCSEPYEYNANPGIATYQDNAVFRLTRSGTLQDELKVFIGFAGTAQYTCLPNAPIRPAPCAGMVDYLIEGTPCNYATFPVGVSQILITIKPQADLFVEDNETVILNLHGSSTYLRGTTTGTVTLYERPVQPYSLETIKGTAVENQQPQDKLIFRVFSPATIAAPAPYSRPDGYLPTHVDYEISKLSDGTYSPWNSGTLEPNGALSYEFEVPVPSDPDHDNETLRLSIVPLSCPPSPVFATIQDCSGTLTGSFNYQDWGQFEMNVTGQEGTQYTIHSSTDALSWSPYHVDSIPFVDQPIADPVADAMFFRLSTDECCLENETTGYIRITIPPKEANGSPKLALVANQLDNGAGNTLSSLMPVMPDGTVVHKFIDGTPNYQTYTWDALEGGWLPHGNATLNPGEGAFIGNPTTEPLVITFVGKLKTGTLENIIPAGTSMRSSMVPNEGGVNDLGLDIPDESMIYRFNTQSQMWESYTFWMGECFPRMPHLRIGEAIYIDAMAAGTWNRTYSPCINYPPFLHLKNGLKGYWKLDESQGTRSDSSGNGYTLTPVNDVGFDAIGILNGSATFGVWGGDTGLFTSGTAAQQALAFTGDWTISTWAKPSTDNPYATDNLFSKPGEIYLWRDGDGRWVLYLMAGAPGYQVLLHHIFEVTATPEVWQHVALRRTDNRIDLFINGQLRETVGVTAPIQNGHHNFWIGMQVDGWPWNGSVDETGYWGRSLTTGEIKALYGNGTPPAYSTFTE